MFHEYLRNLKMRILLQKVFQPIVAHFSVIQQCTKKPKAKKISVELGTRVINGDSHHHLATKARDPRVGGGLARIRWMEKKKYYTAENLWLFGTNWHKTFSY